MRTFREFLWFVVTIIVCMILLGISVAIIQNDQQLNLNEIRERIEKLEDQ